MANYYVSSVGWTNVAAWAASTSYSLNQIVRQLATPTVNNERCWICTTAGTSGATEPTWVITKGSTTSDNGVVWTEITGQEAYQSPGNWAAPFARMNPPTTIFAWYTTLDNLFVDKLHAETSSAVINIGSGTAFGGSAPLAIICVNAGSGSHVPPTSADLATGGGVTQTGNSQSINLVATTMYIQGIVFANNAATGLSQITFSGSTRLDNCELALQGGNVALSIAFNGARSSFWNNTSVFFSSANQTIQLNSSALTWRNTAMPIASFSTIPSSLINFKAGTAEGAILFCEGVDFSALGTNAIITTSSVIVASVTLQSCKLGTTVLNNLVNASAAKAWGGLYGTLSVINCSDGTDYWFHGKTGSANPIEVLQGSKTVIRTGGASDGATSYSWFMTTGNPGNAGSANWAGFFESFPIALWNATVGSPVALSIHGVWNQNRLPNNDEFWLSLVAFGSASNTVSTEVSGDKTDWLATPTALSADTGSAWGSQLTARGNSTVYAVDAIIGIASNPNRVFFCTTAGTSASSVPTGYATATDGTSITDGTATFIAGFRFSQTVTITPQAVGFIRGYARIGNPAGTGGARFYIDPTLS